MRKRRAGDELKEVHPAVLLTFAASSISYTGGARTSYLYSMDRVARTVVMAGCTGNPRVRDSKFVAEIKLAPCFRNRRRLNFARGRWDGAGDEGRREGGREDDRESEP